jgi:hypothetical protein
MHGVSAVCDISLLELESQRASHNFNSFAKNNLALKLNIITASWLFTRNVS